MIQGEKFRPHQIEHEVDKTIASFLEEIKIFDSEEFERLVESKINTSSQFPDNLDEVADKIYSDIDEKLTDVDDSVYHDYRGKLKVNELYEAATKWLVNDSKRITVEMFPALVTDMEKDFYMDRSYSLTEKNYEIVSMEDLIRMKFEN